MSQYKSVSRLLTSSNGNLQSLLEQAHYLQALTRVLREAIDPALADHITIANIRDNTAIVATDTPAWLSKIRYMAPTILTILQHQSGLSGLRKIQFKVQLPAESPAPEQIDHEQNRHATLSSASSKLLESAASGIDDPELASALRRLSRQKNK